MLNGVMSCSACSCDPCSPSWKHFSYGMVIHVQPIASFCRQFFDKWNFPCFSFIDLQPQISYKANWSCVLLCFSNFFLFFSVTSKNASWTGYINGNSKLMWSAINCSLFKSIDWSISCKKTTYCVLTRF